MKIAGVAVEGAAFSFDKEFDYFVASELEERVLPGCRVTVPFGRGNKKRLGIVMSVFEGENRKGLKGVAEVLDEAPLLNDEMLELARRLAERTFCTVFEAAKAMLPSGINHKMVVSYCVSDENMPVVEKLSGLKREIFDYLCAKPGYVKRETLYRNLGIPSDSPLADELVRGGYIACNTDAVRNVGDASVRVITLNDEMPEGLRLTKKQQSVAELLRELGTATVKELCYFSGVTPAVPAGLVKNGAARYVELEVLRTPGGVEPEKPAGEIRLTGEQQAAYDSIERLVDSGNAAVSLLYGVTGSGKTSVYLKAIEHTLSLGKTVIVMVPEIALTPQTLSLFRRRFGKDIAVFHSALSAGERLDEWKRAKRGEAKIVVGTRSAVFAPLENIGLIIIDEEQEHTYKSEQTPRYNAVDVAKFRASKHACLLLLASATPSVESFASAKSGRYSMQTIKSRYGSAVLPEVITVDMLREPPASPSGSVSKKLYEELKKNLEDGMQSILLINRRGFNTFVACDSCGHVVSCPYCSISMTYHAANGRLMCHYCGHSVQFTEVCPECGEKSVRYSGFGTQKIEDELQQLLPGARILRMDTDTTTGKDSHEKLLGSFAAGEYDIMIGTQMVAKGLDFESVTLVGVVSVDQQLYNDDFRSLEKTFSLLTQVVGRSGRGEHRGRAVIQTMTPENDVIRLAARQDYEAFYDSEIKIRKALVYPPFCDICVVAFSGERELKVKAAAAAALQMIREMTADEYKKEKIIVLGPGPARVAKVNNKFRHRLIIKCRNSADFRKMISEILIRFGNMKEYSSVSVFADINPESVI